MHDKCDWLPFTNRIYHTSITAITECQLSSYHCTEYLWCALSLFYAYGQKRLLCCLNTLSSSNFQVSFMLNACTNRVTKFSRSYFGITPFGHLETYIFWAFYKEVVFGYKYALPSYLKHAKQSEKYRIRNRLA